MAVTKVCQWFLNSYNTTSKRGSGGSRDGTGKANVLGCHCCFGMSVMNQVPAHALMIKSLIFNDYALTFKNFTSIS